MFQSSQEFLKSNNKNMLVCFLLAMFNLITLEASDDIHLCEGKEMELRYVFLLKLEVNALLQEYFLTQPGIGLLNIFYSHGLIQVTVDPIKRESLYQFAMATNIFISDVRYCFHVKEVPAFLLKARKDPIKIFEKIPSLQDLVLTAERELNIENSTMSQIAHLRSDNKSISIDQYDVPKVFEGVLYNVSIL